MPQSRSSDTSDLSLCLRALDAAFCDGIHRFFGSWNCKGAERLPVLLSDRGTKSVPLGRDPQSQKHPNPMNLSYQSPLLCPECRPSNLIEPGHGQ